MELFTKMLRKQISAINKIADVCSSEKSHTVQRAMQDKIGEFMAHEYILTKFNINPWNAIKFRLNT